jgi:P4 family phage/plasmid primase-like protien
VDTEVARREATAALEFRLKGAPNESWVTAHYADEHTPFGWLGAYQVRDLRRLIDDVAGRQTDTWVRTTTMLREPDRKHGVRGSAQDTAGSHFLWVDLDPPTHDLDDEWKRQKIADLQRFTPVPSRIEDSGRGLYALWRLASFEPDWQRIERTNKWLAGLFGGDRCWDSARILRVPGTLNVGVDRWAKVLWRSDKDDYWLTQFNEADLDPTEKRVHEADVQPEVLALDFDQQVRAMRGGEVLWQRIETEVGALNAGAPTKSDGSVQRFRNDLYIALNLLRGGAQVGHVFSVLTHPVWFSGDKYREEGYHDSYILRTIDAAITMTELDDEKNPVLLAQKLEETIRLMVYRDEWYRFDTNQGLHLPGAENYVDLTLQDMLGKNWRPRISEEVRATLRPRAIERGKNIPEHVIDLGKLIPVTNGLLNWETGELRPPEPRDPVFWTLPAKWDQKADTTEVDKYLEDLMEPYDIDLWWMFSGYCLTTSTEFRIILAIKGEAMTGKSTLLKTLQMFVGEHNTSTMTLENLTSRLSDFGLEPLLDKRLNVDFDASTGPVNTTNLLQKIATGDPVSVNRKNRTQLSSVLLTTKLAFVMNDYPQFPNAPKAFYTRWRTLEIKADRLPWVGSTDIPKFHLHLMQYPENRSAWLKRSVEGLRKLYENNGFPPDRFIAQMQRQTNPIFRFWSEATTEGDPNGEWRKLRVAYDAYREWCVDNGQLNPLSLQVFAPHSSSFTSRFGRDHYSLPGLQIRQADGRWEFKGRDVTYGGVRFKGVPITGR